MDNNEKNKITWLDKVLLKTWPKLQMERMAKKMKIENPIFEKLHEVFSSAKTIDIFPRGGSDGRSFILVLDHETALFFYQDGDHFAYDGFEMGEYAKGDVTVFDDLKKKNLSPYPDEK